LNRGERLNKLGDSLFSAKFFLEKRSKKLYEVKLLVFLRLFNKHYKIKQNSEYILRLNKIFEQLDYKRKSL